MRKIVSQKLDTAVDADMSDQMDVIGNSEHLQNMNIIFETIVKRRRSKFLIDTKLSIMVCNINGDFSPRGISFFTAMKDVLTLPRFIPTPVVFPLEKILGPIEDVALSLRFLNYNIARDC
jgi:hypothetical protein